MSEHARPCPRCNGTGNAGHSGHVDEYGCSRCGGCGHLDGRIDVPGLLITLGLAGLFVWTWLL